MMEPPIEKTSRVSFISTPIGNLADLSFRALETIKQADIIACEDTRHSGRLLKHYEIEKKTLLSFFQHNEARRTQELIEKLETTPLYLAVLSDAGTPMVSDPGERLLLACINADIQIETIPGPCAIIPGLSGSGLPIHPFYFGGFLPQKSGGRKREVEKALSTPHTSVFYESPHRLLKTLLAITEIDPDRPLCVAREITKRFETWHRGTALALSKEFAEKPPKGEITLIISGSDLPEKIRALFHRI